MVATQAELVICDAAIENSLHSIKDVTLGEDASLIHTGQRPANMSLLRDTVISLVHAAG